MSPIIFFIFCCMTTLGASGKNDVENYKNLTRMRSVKKPRFISLGGITDSINVGLDFSVPFLKIPLNKNTHSGFGLNHLGAPILTFDPTSLAFGGILVLVTSFLASAFTKDFAPMQNHRRYGRHHDNMADTFLEISQIVMSNCQNCPSRIACWISRNSDRESLKTWKQITRNELLATMLNTTAVENAFNFGRNGGDCEFFRPCPLGAEQFSQIISNSPKLSKTVL